MKNLRGICGDPCGVDEMMGDQGGKGHTLQKRSNKLKKIGGYLINWMISVGSWRDRPFKSA